MNTNHVSDAIAALDPPDGLDPAYEEELERIANAAIDEVAEKMTVAREYNGLYVTPSSAFMAITGERSLRRSFVNAHRELILREIRSQLPDKAKDGDDEVALELAMEGVK